MNTFKQEGNDVFTPWAGYAIEGYGIAITSEGDGYA